MLSPEMQTQLMATAASLQHTADAVTKLAQQAGPAATQLPGALLQLQRTLASANALFTNLDAPRGQFERRSVLLDFHAGHPRERNIAE